MAQKKAKTTDDLSFGEAFKIFRKKHGGDGGRFRWKGNVYTTDFAKPKTKSKSSAPATSKRPQARTPAATSSGPSKRPVVTGAKPPTSTGPSKRPALKSPGRAEANARIGPKPAPKPPKAMTSMSWEASGFKTMGALSGIDSKLPLQGNRRLFPSAETTVKRPKAPAKPSVGSVLKKFLSQMQRNRRRPGSSNPR